MEDLEMKTTPPALKWLAEKRARVAGDIAQTERVLADSTERLAKLTLDLASLDRSIQVYDSRLSGDEIDPIRARVLYGRRGALREFVEEQLKLASPDWVPTTVIEGLVVAHYGLGFVSALERKRWQVNSLRSALKGLVRKGKLEREQNPEVATGEVGRWRWKAPAPTTLAALRASAPSPELAEAAE